MAVAAAPPTSDELIRRRAFAVGLGNIPLVVVVWIGLRFAYGASLTNKTTPYIACLIGVVISGMVVGTERMFQNFSGAFNVPPITTSWGDSARRSRGAIALLFSVLALIVALDFFAMGHIIQVTGGILMSPFAQVPLIMIILGAVMAKQTPSRVVLGVLGMTYFSLLQYTTLLGHSDHVSGARDGVPKLWLTVTGMNLIVSVGLQILQDRQQRNGDDSAPMQPGSDDGPAADGDGSSLMPPASGDRLAGATDRSVANGIDHLDAV